MGYNHNRIKENARLFYKNNTGNSIVSQLIYFGVMMGIMIVLYIGIFVVTVGMTGGLLLSISGDSVIGTIITTLLGFLVMLVVVSAMYLAVYPLSMGIMNWYRKSIYEPTPLGEIFTPFKKEQIVSNFVTMFLVQLFIGLWSLLFVIPGIIKGYSYSQAAFIKTENPKISPMRAIELSKIMMEGHKADLFYLHLSFIGWMLLSGFTYNILGIVYVYPYFYSALSFAYIEIKSDAIARGLINASEFANEKEIFFEEQF